MARARSSPEPVFTPSLQRERELQASGFTRIAGVDEAGRGPLAGPVVAGAVILPSDFSTDEWPLLNDSKQLSSATREDLFECITTAFEYGIGSVDAATIDQINIRQASWRAMQLAVTDLTQRNAACGVLAAPVYVLIDGLGYGLGPWPYEAIIKGDTKSLSIAAASIVAKVTRDRMMIELDSEYSGYGFDVHKGYPTSAHLRALEKLGPCAIHRQSFAPVKSRSARGTKFEGLKS
jgi:ribonuclease HII